MKHFLKRFGADLSALIKKKLEQPRGLEVTFEDGVWLALIRQGLPDVEAMIKAAKKFRAGVPFEFVYLLGGRRITFPEGDSEADPEAREKLVESFLRIADGEERKREAAEVRRRDELLRRELINQESLTRKQPIAEPSPKVEDLPEPILEKPEQVKRVRVEERSPYPHPLTVRARRRDDPNWGWQKLGRVRLFGGFGRGDGGLERN